MKAKETISADLGVLTFGRELAVSVDQVQHLEAAEYAEGKWRLEVKCAHRASPLTPFEGTEGQVRKKLALAANALRREKERVRLLEMAPWRAQ